MDGERQIEIEASPRQRRCYAVACCRRIWSLLKDERSRNAVEVAERYADGLATDAELAEARERAESVLESPSIQHHPAWEDSPRICAAVTASEAAATDTAPRDATESSRWAMIALGSLGFRDDFGSIWRDVFGAYCLDKRFSPSWRTDTAVTLARQMYESREFGAMPILADALQDAGCDNDDVLSHCRDTAQVHARGCWVCDLVLGKT